MQATTWRRPHAWHSGLVCVQVPRRCGFGGRTRDASDKTQRRGNYFGGGPGRNSPCAPMDPRPPHPHPRPRAVLENSCFFVRDSPLAQPLGTINRQPPTANCRQPPPIAHRRQPPTIVKDCFCGVVSCPYLDHDAESVHVSVRFCWHYEPFSPPPPPQDSPALPHHKKQIASDCETNIGTERLGGDIWA